MCVIFTPKVMTGSGRSGVGGGGRRRSSSGTISIRISL